MNNIYESERTIDLDNGCKIVIKWDYDEYGDLSYLGTFTDKRDTWSVDRKTGQLLGEWHEVTKHLPPAKAKAWVETMEANGYDVSTYDSNMRGWIECVAYGLEVLRDDLPKWYDSREYRYVKLSDVHGYNPPKDDEELGYLVEDYKRIHGYTRDDWSYMVCTVTIYDSEDNDIGKASLCGIESDSDDSDRLGVEWDLLSDAQAQAQRVDSSFTCLNVDLEA